MYLNLTYFNDSKSGNLISRLINDTYYLRLYIVGGISFIYLFKNDSIYGLYFMSLLGLTYFIFLER